MLPKAPQISIDDFLKVDIRAGTVQRAEAFPKARKPAYKVWVDFGPEIGVLQTSAQITDHYTPEILKGRKVMGCVNLGPRNIAGFMSEFLLLGFSGPGNCIKLTEVDQSIDDGERLH